MVFMRMRDDEADKISLQLLDEAEVGHQEIDARQVRAGESQSEIHEDPLARTLGTKSIQHGIHADLAKTAQRRENQFTVH